MGRGILQYQNTPYIRALRQFLLGQDPQNVGMETVCIDKMPIIYGHGDTSHGENSLKIWAGAQGTLCTTKKHSTY